jgi:hypothetical protein
MKKTYKAFLPKIYLISLLLSGCTLLNTPKTNPVETLNQLSQTLERNKSETPTIFKNIELVEKTITPVNLFSREQQLMQTYETNGGCELPCYWGITPGDTSWDAASKFVSSIGELFGPVYNGEVAHYSADFGKLEGELGVMSVGYYVKNGKVIAIATRCDWVRQDLDYSLSGLLKLLGMPEEIWIRLVTETQTDQPYYYMVLRYPSKGLYVEWIANVTVEGENLSVCAQDMLNRVPHAPWLVLWDPEEKAPFRQFGLKVLGDDLGKITNEYELLENISVDQVKNEEFFEMYSVVETKTCIKVE